MHWMGPLFGAVPCPVQTEDSLAGRGGARRDAALLVGQHGILMWLVASMQAASRLGQPRRLLPVSTEIWDAVMPKGSRPRSRKPSSSPRSNRSRRPPGTRRLGPCTEQQKSIWTQTGTLLAAVILQRDLYSHAETRSNGSHEEPPVRRHEQHQTNRALGLAGRRARSPSSGGPRGFSVRYGARTLPIACVSFHMAPLLRRQDGLSHGAEHPIALRSAELSQRLLGRNPSGARPRHVARSWLTRGVGRSRRRFLSLAPFPLFTAQVQDRRPRDAGTTRACDVVRLMQKPGKKRRRGQAGVQLQILVGVAPAAERLRAGVYDRRAKSRFDSRGDRRNIVFCTAFRPRPSGDPTMFKKQWASFPAQLFQVTTVFHCQPCIRRPGLLIASVSCLPLLIKLTMAILTTCLPANQCKPVPHGLVQKRRAENMSQRARTLCNRLRWRCIMIVEADTRMPLPRKATHVPAFLVQRTRIPVVIGREQYLGQ